MHSQSFTKLAPWLLVSVWFTTFITLYSIIAKVEVHICKNEQFYQCKFILQFSYRRDQWKVHPDNNNTQVFSNSCICCSHKNNNSPCSDCPVLRILIQCTLKCGVRCLEQTWSQILASRSCYFGTTWFKTSLRLTGQTACCKCLGKEFGCTNFLVLIIEITKFTRVARE